MLNLTELERLAASEQRDGNVITTVYVNDLLDLLRIARAVKEWGEARAVGSLAGYMELNEIADSLAEKEGA